MNKFLNVNEVADYLRLNPQTIYRMAESGKIPAFKVGRHWRFRKESIDTWIENQENKALDADRFENLTCCLCEKVIRDSSMLASTCSEEGCEQPICTTCWNVKKRRYCLQHESQLVKESPLNQNGFDADLIQPDSDYIGCLKSLEFNFIGRFDTIIRNEKNISDATGKLIAKNVQWEKQHKTVNDLNKIIKIVGKHISRKELVHKYPLNNSSLYKIPLVRGRKFARKSNLFLEAKYLIKHKELFDGCERLSPIGLDTLVHLVEARQNKAKRLRGFIVIGIYSPSGWNNEASQYISGALKKKSFKSVHCAVCLIGPSLSEVTWDISDKTILPFVRYFKGDTFDEEVKECMYLIKEKITMYGSLQIRQLQNDLDFSDDVIKKACIQIAESREDLEIKSLKKIGEILTWKK